MFILAMNSSCIFVLAAVLAMGAWCSAASGGDRLTGRAFATRSEVIAKHGMAATSQPLATQVAIEILKKGGSAVDAAIAANATLGLMEPTGNGIGGDLFAIVWDANTKKLHGLNASGRSPYGLTRAHFADLGLTSIPAYGPLPVSVPGCVDGWSDRGYFSLSSQTSDRAIFSGEQELPHQPPTMRTRPSDRSVALWESRASASVPAGRSPWPP